MTWHERPATDVVIILKDSLAAEITSLVRALHGCAVSAGILKFFRKYMALNSIKKLNFATKLLVMLSAALLASACQSPIYLSGDTYSGEYSGIKREGRGIYTYANGDRYVGEFSNNNFNGYGTLHFANGDQYAGQFKDNIRTGNGTYLFDDGRKYAGNFRNNKQHGQGICTYPNGDRYVGEWKNGKQHGLGTMTYAQDRIPLAGIWENGQFVRMQKVEK